MRGLGQLVTIVGILCILLGLLWAGQGAGLIRWPSDSFMIGVADWTVRGAVVAAIGAVLVWLGRRLGRR